MTLGKFFMVSRYSRTERAYVRWAEACRIGIISVIANKWSSQFPVRSARMKRRSLRTCLTYSIQRLPVRLFPDTSCIKSSMIRMIRVTGSSFSTIPASHWDLKSIPCWVRRRFRLISVKQPGVSNTCVTNAAAVSRCARSARALACPLV